jgi:hypothetical protein
LSLKAREALLDSMIERMTRGSAVGQLLELLQAAHWPTQSQSEFVEYWEALSKEAEERLRGLGFDIAPGVFSSRVRAHKAGVETPEGVMTSVEVSR